MSFFQSFFRYKSTFKGTHIEHIDRNVEDTPKDLFPMYNMAGTIKPIRGPETYQGHEENIKSMRTYFERE